MSKVQKHNYKLLKLKLPPAHFEAGPPPPPSDFDPETRWSCGVLHPYSCLAFRRDIVQFSDVSTVRILIGLQRTPFEARSGLVWPVAVLGIQGLLRGANPLMGSRSRIQSGGPTPQVQLQGRFVLKFVQFPFRPCLLRMAF